MTDIASISITTAKTQIPEQQKKLEAAAEAFEAIFARNMIGAMRKASIGKDMLASSSMNQFRDMMDAQTADVMAKSRSLGIAQFLIEQWKGKL